MTDGDGGEGQGNAGSGSSGTVFADGKDPDAFRTIGEVAAALNIRQHVMRYWEEQFPMLRPVKRSGGRRYYRPEDVKLVETIDRLVHREGYTLRGARQTIEAQMKGRPARGAGDIATEPFCPAAATVAEAIPGEAILADAIPGEATMVRADDVVGHLRVIRETLAAALDA